MSIIKEARLKKEFTMKELAKQVGVSWITIQNWEKGRHNKYLNQYKKLCEILNINIHDL